MHADDRNIGPIPFSSPSSLDAGRSLAGRRVLLVEDDDINQEIAAALLASLGLQADIASTGLEALERLALASYEAVLMDTQMPVMDGITAAAEIRRMPSLASMPIIAMSASAQAEDRERCRQAGMVDFIAKPIDPADLLRVLLRWLGPTAEPHGRTDMPGPQEALEPAGLRIPGLNVAQGLVRVMGRRDLYTALLRKFAERYGTQTVDDIERAVHGGDTAHAERLSHTLKGVAGNIAAQAVFEAASAVESALRRGDHDLDDRLAALRQVLLSLVSSLDLHFSMPASQNEQAPVFAPGDALARLKQLIAEDDPAAAGWLTAQRGALDLALGARYASLQAALEDFDYEAAEDILNAATAS